MTTQFSQKHYIAIAKVLATQIGVYKELGDATTTERKAVRRVTLSLATLFHDDNPKFDEDRFLKAAGVR